MGKAQGRARFLGWTTVIIGIAAALDDPSFYYDRCKPFTCANIAFPFPFSSSADLGVSPLECGLPGYQIACDASTGAASLTISGRPYRVISIYPAQNLTVSDERLTSNLLTVSDERLISDITSGSCKEIHNASAYTPSLELPSFGLNISIFKCASSALRPNLLHGSIATFNCSDDYHLYLSQTALRIQPAPVKPLEQPSGCELVAVPVSTATMSSYGLLALYKTGEYGTVTLNDSQGVLKGNLDQRRKVLAKLLEDGFPLRWRTPPACESCQKIGGRCVYDSSVQKIDCLCDGGSCDRTKPKRKWKLVTGVATGGGSAAAILCLALAILKKKRARQTFRHKPAGDGANARQFIQNYTSSILTSYSYGEVKKMVNGFGDKLGEGGCGSVYKGRLPDGRAVAVKMLDKYRAESRDFVNEVSTIGTIHHVNVIRLLGFCWDGARRALVYEYMPNGSLADFLSRRRVPPPIEYPRLLRIAVGVAHGIQYLHRGCSSRILHLDIKPQNVLLDEGMNPKISDFGMAKVSSRSRSDVTMTTGARGTVGYIAPEIFMRRFGNPSEKSDVYSYGMLLLEIVGARNDDGDTSSDATFPCWIYDKLIAGEAAPARTGAEEEAMKKMIMVGLWCVRMKPQDRPSMGKAIEMLCGSVESIEMPPRQPFLFSPPPASLQFQDDTQSIECWSDLYPPTASQRLELEMIHT